ncbi:MAG: fibronectin type III domain-containing protein [Paludibacter sp.]|nr:fibronectin type III domain-containing protein [Paludibacter sp.]
MKITFLLQLLVGVIAKNHTTRTLIILLLLSVFDVSSSWCVDFYLKPTGTRTSGASTVNDWTNGNCYATISSVFSKMNGGDTVTLDDGVYPDISANTINQFNYPKSGTAQQFTVIKARNIPGKNGLPINTPLRVKIMAPFSNSNYPSNNSAIYVKYIKWEGLQFPVVSIYSNWDFNYFKQCAVQGGYDGNTSAWNINGQNNLLEDCVAYGKGRYKFLFYEQSRDLQSKGDNNNVCRRCIARQDWSNKNNIGPNPIGGMSSYYARGTVFLNSIVIDGNTPDYWMASPGEISGAFYLPNDNGPHKLIIKGSLAVNNAYSAVVMRIYSTENFIEDFVGLSNAGGIYGLGTSTYTNRVAIYNSGTNLFNYRAATQISQNLGINVGLSGYTGFPSVVKNSIVSGVNCAVNGSGANAISADFVDFFNNGDNTACKVGIGSLGTNQIALNPLTSGWLYPVRIESNSALKTAGLAGSQVGPNIINKLGKDGTFKGDTDWDTPQGNLWPFPMEEWVQAQMRSMDTQIWSDGVGQDAPFNVGHYDTMPDPNRGFCAAGQTLTNYIWGYLGNTVPPFNLSTSLTSSGLFNLTWAPNTANTDITGYKVYVGTSPGNYNLTGYVGGKNVGLATSETLSGLTPGTLYYAAVTAVDSIKGASGYSYEISFTTRPKAPTGLTGVPIP